MRHFTGIDELAAEVGDSIGRSDWYPVTQERVSLFADATDDHQWIHLDADRAAVESAYGSTVAHGYLTLSLIPRLVEDVFAVAGVSMIVNYGSDRVRYPAPLPAGSRIRAEVTPVSVDPVPAGKMVRLRITIERENHPKPVCVAETLSLYVPND